MFFMFFFILVIIFGIFFIFLVVLKKLKFNFFIFLVVFLEGVVRWVKDVLNVCFVKVFWRLELLKVIIVVVDFFMFYLSEWVLGVKNFMVLFICFIFVFVLVVV